MIPTNYYKAVGPISLLLLLVLSTISGRTLAQNPILPGDHPDPTIVRIGNTYWTASTSGNWAPEFPLYQSTDLHHWTAAGAVFPQTPEWASGSFWAPEMVADHGRVLVYYVARMRGGPLCVAVATAAHAEGPYTDHGPILCQPDGSIDPSFVRDEHG
jgi:xylan 1,4-beta-xylosidase